MTSPSKPKRLPPLSVRLNAEQRSELAGRAGNVPLSTYVKAVLFGADAPKMRRSPRTATLDQLVVAKLLAYLGASHMAQNLAGLAEDSRNGSLLMDEEDKARLASASSDLRVIRKLLMQALGKDAPEN